MGKQPLLRATLAVVSLVPLNVVPTGAQAAAAPSGDATAYQLDAAHDGYAATGGLVSYPVITAGRIFVTVAATSGYGTVLHALDARTGMDVWEPIDLHGSYRWSALTLGGGRLYALNFDGELNAYDIDTGKLLWHTDFPAFSYTSSPTYRRGIVYTGGAGSDGTLYGVNARTGAVVWHKQVYYGHQSSPAVTSTGVYVSYTCEKTDRFDPLTGAHIWSRTTSCIGGGGRTPVVAVGSLWVRDSKIGGLESVRLTLESGAVQGTFGHVGTPAPAFLGHTGFFVGDGALHARSTDEASTTMWTFAGDGTISSAPIVVNSYVYVGSEGGHVYALDPTTGRCVWSPSVGAPVNSPDERNVASPLTGLAAGQGILAVPASRLLVAYGG